MTEYREWKCNSARIAGWLGHESVAIVRRTYEHEARTQRKKYGLDRLKRALKATARVNVALHVEAAL